jgi:hypothetical protein
LGTESCGVHISGVRGSLHFRLFAVVVALLGSLSASAFALTHGLVHAHLAHEHEQAELGQPAHDASMLALEEHSSDDHAHVHFALDAVIGTRQLGRLDLPTADVAMLPVPAVMVEAVIVVRAPALSDRALLARPDPGGGPPPTLRAPPIS